MNATAIAASGFAESRGNATVCERRRQFRQAPLKNQSPRFANKPAVDIAFSYIQFHSHD
ncbi:hypothetical protein [Burkholderia perseverans]|uniref:hypothetical protein n=1 Tax=Burkholderia perseverans TaxID=2615214 RepID=UPI001FEECDC0|nr:hypothetical protein [Burkholderia perseverans]